MGVDVSIKVVGLENLLARERTVGAKTEGVLTEHLKNVGEFVTRDVQGRYLNYSVAGGYGVQEKVFTSGLWVVQTIRKSRNPLRQRPNFGGLMMRHAFLPAARDNTARVGIAARLAIEEVRTRYWDD